ncbi:MAG: hypothetical protein KC708_06000 [Anaerolineae bacterium]|nr:hypothetical protein [Anaerolineae bacterium]
MRRFLIPIVGVVILLAVGISIAQNSSPQSFTVFRQFGTLRPRGMIYDPNYDQFAWVDREGRLVLADAATYTPRHILYETTDAFNDYQFSHDGRWLALAVDVRIELWNTQTGELTTTLEPEGILQAQGPLRFGDDDRLLQFDSLVRAPAELRRSENDTLVLSWLWDLPAARRESSPSLPGRSRAYAFFEYRGSSLVMGTGDYVVAGAPGRLIVMDAGDETIPIMTSIDSNRLERDPFNIWTSARDQYMYVLPKGRNYLVQIDPETGTTFNIPVGRDIRYSTLDDVQGLGFSSLHTVIGEANSQQDTPLMRLLLGENYLPGRNFSAQTLVLLDILDPLTVPEEDAGFLIYRFDRDQASGVIEFINPSDILQFALHPDNRHLMVRRTNLPQQIEVYNLETGALEHVYYPERPDTGGQRILAYNRDGSVITSDMQRIDAVTGETLYHDPNIDFESGQITFTEDSSGIISRVFNTWRIWDIESQSLVRESTIQLRGDVIGEQNDLSRYLTVYTESSSETVLVEAPSESSSDAGETETSGQSVEATPTITPTTEDDAKQQSVEGEPENALEVALVSNTYYEITDVWSGERSRFRVPKRENYVVEQVIPSADWQHYIVIYSYSLGDLYLRESEVMVFDFDGRMMVHLTDNNMPSSQERRYSWLDNDRIVIRSSQEYQANAGPILGVDYHVSGLPQCMVSAYPDTWQQFLPLWEMFNLRFSNEQLSRITQRICQNLPAEADAFVESLTPTPPYYYPVANSADTSLIVGVPECLTRRFSESALEYAELWRAMSTGLDETGLRELETMLCEGLLSSVSRIEATATSDPTTLGGPTATPVESAAGSVTRGSSTVPGIMVIDIYDQTRTVGSYLPETETTTIRSQLGRVIDEYEDIYNTRPDGNVYISPNGEFMAVQDTRGFVTLYQLGLPRPDLVYVNRITRDVPQTPVRSTQVVGLLPTATESLSYLSAPLPTLTPTVSPTAPPQAEATYALENRDEVVEVCPYDHLFTLDNPPPDFAAEGSLFVQPNSAPAMWVLDVASGSYRPVDTLPLCGYEEACEFSPDGEWMLINGNAPLLSRTDGSDTQTVLPDTERPVLRVSANWMLDSRLQLRFEQYDLEEASQPLAYYQAYDPATGEYGDITRPLDPPQIYELPTTIVSVQPVSQEWALVWTPYDGAYAQGRKYYMYHYPTQTFSYFLRTIGTSLDSTWHPTGDVLYYRPPDQDDWFVFDTTSQTHSVWGEIYNGERSPDGTLRMVWYNIPDANERQQRLLNQELLPKLQLWNSQTGELRRYCLPETGQRTFGGVPLLWSPDNRYVAFRVQLPPEGDVFPVPTVKYTPVPTATPIPPEQVYQYQTMRTLVLDTQTGSVTILSREAEMAFVWVAEEVTR